MIGRLMTFKCIPTTLALFVAPAEPDKEVGSNLRPRPRSDCHVCMRRFECWLGLVDDINDGATATRPENDINVPVCLRGTIFR